MTVWEEMKKAQIAGVNYTENSYLLTTTTTVTTEYASGEQMIVETDSTQSTGQKNIYRRESKFNNYRDRQI